MGIVEAYHYYVTEQADPRTNDWFFVGSPLNIGIVIFSYLYFIFGCGKRYMQNKEPHSLKTFIKFYNIFQIISNALIVYEIVTLSYTTGDLTFRCRPVNYSYNPQAIKLATLTWCFYMLKLIDLLETVIFVLRKKDKQISILHLYHHVITFITAWMATKYAPGGMALVCILLNGTMHVIMYTYYLCSSLDNFAIQQFSNFIKSHITKIQMIQLALLLLHILQAFLPSCSFSKPVSITIVINVSVNLYLFYKFYTQNYMRNEKVK